MSRLPIIESIQNGMVKHAYSLKVAKKAKASEDFLCEGFHLVEEALRSGVRLRFILGTQQAWDGAEGQAILQKALAQKTKCFEAPSKVIAYVADTMTPQGIVAVAGKMEERYPAPPLGRLLALYQLQDAGNLGTIFRSAEAFGIHGIFLTEGCCDPFNPKVVRSSMGSLFRVPFVHGGKWGEYQAWFQEKGYRTFALSHNGDQDLIGAQCPETTVFWIGAEGSGLPEDLLRDCQVRLRIPMSGKNESLNAAVAASLAMFWAAFGAPRS